MENKYCYLCEAELQSGSGSSRICSSMLCRLNYQRHLEQRKPTCHVCARPLFGVSEEQVTCSSLLCRSQHAHILAVPQLAAARCQVCRIPLPAGRIGFDNCGDRDCLVVKDRLQILQRQEQEQRRKNQLIAQAELMRDACGDEEPASKHAQQQQIPVVLVPHTAAAITPADANRVRQLQEHLESLVVQTVCQLPDESDVPCDMRDYHHEPSEQETPVFNNACRLCRGHCCVAGGTTAFLSISTIRRVVRDRPELNPNEIVAQYLERVPARSCEGSCVFHGEFGCTLPREMRADMCNRYLCRDLLHARQLIELQGPQQLFIAAATHDAVAAAEFIDVPSSSRPA
ncbi:MAG: hypothetical protein KDB22_15075 [Planctomycetales bacterium]|nr:hypothetical protein [Planctomycetales bacterium]